MSKKINIYPTEDEEQKILATYLNYKFEYYGWIHVPNQRWAKIQYMKKLNLMGVKKGFPDILILEHIRFHDNNRLMLGEDIGDIRFVGMAIELKRQKGNKPSNDQLIWLSKLNTRYYWYSVVAYGAQDAINKINEVYK